MNLFDLVKIMFADKATFGALSWHEKGKEMFMIQRLMSIKKPELAQMFNRPTPNPGSIVEAWHLVVGSIGKVPGWIWTKTKKNENTIAAFKPKPEIAKIWMRVHQVGKRELNERIQFDLDELKAELKAIEKSIDV